VPPGLPSGAFLQHPLKIAKRSGHETVGKVIEWSDALISVKGALDRIAEIGAKRGVIIKRIDWVRYGDYVRIRVRYIYTHVK
jgi:hypothetical protein